MMKGKIIFKETQSFVGTWMWYLVIGISILSVIGATISYIYGDKPEGVVGLIITILVLVCLIALLYTSKLHVRIDTNSIYYRFPPFINSEKVLTKGDIKEMYVRKYKPIWEYGGYGYRFRFRSGRAVLVHGNMGLQLVFKNEKKLLIGTQKPDLMSQATKRLKDNWGSDG